MTIDLKRAVEELESLAVETRRHLHAHPEIGMDVPLTAAYVESFLKEHQITNYRVGTNGIVGIIGKKSGKCILLRADMDALPIIEDNNLSFKSKKVGAMHACGHDIHTTMLLMAAKILKDHEDLLKGTVKLMFQPGEETLEGAQDMIQNGVLINPKVDAALMLHVLSGVPMDVGSILILNDGPVLAAADGFKIDIKGVGGHGSTPYQAVDPIPAMSAIIQASQNIQTRELEPNSVNTITFGEIMGATSPNVISDSIRLGGTIRTYLEKDRNLIKNRLSTMSKYIGLAHKCEVSVNFPYGCPVFVNDKKLVDLAIDILPKYLDEDKVIVPKSLGVPFMSSEDFAYISQEVPTVILMTVAGDSRQGEIYGVHHPKVVFNEKTIASGITTHVAMTLKYLNDN